MVPLMLGNLHLGFCEARFKIQRFRVQGWESGSSSMIEPSGKKVAVSILVHLFGAVLFVLFVFLVLHGIIMYDVH